MKKKMENLRITNSTLEYFFNKKMNATMCEDSNELELFSQDGGGIKRFARVHNSIMDELFQIGQVFKLSGEYPSQSSNNEPNP